jgi:hypothetical protein
MHQRLNNAGRYTSGKAVAAALAGPLGVVVLGDLAQRRLSGAAAAIVAMAGVIIAGAAARVPARTRNRPDRLHVQRSLSIRASVDRIVPLINDLRPLDTRSPLVIRTPTGGERASLQDRGAAGNGSNRIEIVNAEPLPGLAVRLALAEPLAALSRLALVIEPQGDAVRVIWTMAGEVSFLGRLLRLILDVDGMIGRTFEAYLADLRTLAE